MRIHTNIRGLLVRPLTAAALALTAIPLVQASDYESVVLRDRPLAYYRLNDTTPHRAATATNSGSLGAAGNGAYFPGTQNQVPGALAGSSDTAAGYTAIDQVSCDGGVPTIVPFRSELNTATFSVEAWLKPTLDGLGNAQCPLYNRKEVAVLTGWAIYQRGQTAGWNFRGYNGVDANRSIDITGGPYAVGAWSHLVLTFDGSVAKLYVNGVLAGSQSGVTNYVPNTDPISFCVGGFASGTENPFIGSMDEVALYKTALTGAQVTAHYQNGNNAARTTPYESLIVADGAVEYLRLNEPARNVVANLGSLGAASNGTYVNTTNGLPGPQYPAYAGFATNNVGTSFDGATSYLELGNPAGLNFSGPITLEAWVQPGSSQYFTDADILAHGFNLMDDPASAEVVLRIEYGNYQILSLDEGGPHGVAFAAPLDDFGTVGWVHLVGTYDGSRWNLYRNGVLEATTLDVTGAVPVTNANWAIGARGRWKNGPGYPTAGQDRVFYGGIDEVAIYNHALTQGQVAAHYSIGLAGVHPLKIRRTNASVTLEWATGTLQQADAVTGPYTNVPGAVTPYEVPPDDIAARKFYRLKF